MEPNLIELSERAFRYMQAGNFAEAAQLYEQVLAVDPSWDAGSAVYDLGNCYEELGELDKAERCYRAAVAYRPTDPALLGGLASFCYLHRDSAMAFREHLNLVRGFSHYGLQHEIDDLIPFLRTLGMKAGYSEAEVDEQIKIARAAKQGGL